MATTVRFSLLRFCVIFCLALVIFYVVSAQLGIASALGRADARALDLALRTMGYPSQSAGNMVDLTRIRLIIIAECTGLYSMLILTAATLAYPAPPRAKAFGVVLGLVFISAANLIRLVTVAMVGYHWQKAFRVFHVYLWQVTLILMIFLAWALWMKWIDRLSRPQAAGTVAEQPADPGPPALGE